MREIEIAIIGAGPAGMAAAIEAAQCGADVHVFDENHKVGGQLFKQLHKFFGSSRHFAGIRGFSIATEFYEKLRSLGVSIHLDSTVYGLFPGNVLGIHTGDKNCLVKARRIILATGASEIALPFPGWTLPGVMGAGAIQTMMNIHRVLPGKKILMIGGGNVGLIVSYQLMQAGAEVCAVVDALPNIKGYNVHAAKIMRAGVPIYLEHSIKEAIGTTSVEGAVIAKLNRDKTFEEGTEKHFDVDTICIAIGLQPLTELTTIAGCEMEYQPLLGGYVPKRDEFMETTVCGLYVAGDLSGVSEASSAIEEGRLAGICASKSLGYEVKDFMNRVKDIKENLDILKYKQIEKKCIITPEQKNLIKSKLRIECFECIPCNPCVSACSKNAITIQGDITNIPSLNEELCIGCGKCIAACPGLAIFLVDNDYSETEALIQFPYEYLPLPKAGDIVEGVNRKGESVTKAVVKLVRCPAVNKKTAVISVIVPKQFAEEVRSIRRLAR